MRKAIITAIALLLTACTSPKQAKELEQVYNEQMPCNGEVEVSHSVVISSDESTKQGQPEISAVCNPIMYDPQSDFEKANRDQQ